MPKKFNLECVVCYNGMRGDNERAQSHFKLFTPKVDLDAQGAICEKCETYIDNLVKRRRASSAQSRQKAAALKGARLRRKQELIASELKALGA